MRPEGQVSGPPAAVELAPEAAVGGYRIDSLVRVEPGVGSLYTALGPEGQEVTLKLFEPGLSRDAGFRERFLRDALKRAEFTHPYALDWYGGGSSEYGLFVVFERVRGPTLASLLATNKLAPAVSLRLLADLADTLEAAYDQGLVHRDLEPRNVQFDSQDPGHPLLTDLGVGRPSGRAGALAGSPHYLSPEEVRGEEVGCDSNVYSLACILYECLTGSPPFPVGAERAVLEAHLVAPRPRVTERRADLAEEVDAVLATGLAKQPHERYESPVDLVLCAVEALAATPTALLRPPAPTTTAPTARAAPAQAGHAVAPETPTAAPDPERPPLVKRERVNFGRAAVITAAVVGFGVTGLLCGTQTNESARAPTTVTSDGLRLRLPDSWHRRGTLEPVPGLAVENAIAVGPKGDASAGLVAGRTRARDATLVAVGAAPGLEGTPPRRDAVRLGDLEAYRYRGLRPSGYDRRLVLYTTPNTRGVVTVACFARTYGPFLGECERVAGTLAVLDGRPLQLGPGPAYLRALDGALGELRPRRAALRRQLRVAKTRRQQAKAAGALAREYQSTARALGAPRAGARARPHAASIGEALEGVGAAYRGLAVAAAGGRRRAYDASAQAVRDREATLRRAIEALD